MTRPLTSHSLMCATWMAHTGISARIIDKRGTKIFNGQADGLQCRSLEIFDSFGFADRAVKEANHMMEFSMWNPGPDGKLRRDDRVADTPVGVSRFHEMVLHQGRIERFFLDNIKKYSEKQQIVVERGILPLEISIDEESVEDEDAYPVTIKLRHLTEEEAAPEQSKANTGVSDGLFRSNLAPDDTADLVRSTSGLEGREETVKAKYVVGCDGAHSWVRSQLGFKLEGEPTDYIWGVLDVVPITDFPDIRNRCSVHSESSGSLMVIPREDGLVRFYVQLNAVKPDASGRADRSKITPDIILKSAQSILAPYTMTYKHCHWWTAYQIGQRVGTNFSKSERIFLAGDAVHTHSPKAGQGMNVSMQDTYNLGWKIAHCVQKRAPRSILKTYQSERRRVAQDLIAFDHKFSRLFSGKPAKDAADEAGVSMEEFKRVFQQGAMFAAGLTLNYGRSMLVAKEGDSQEQGDGTNVESSNSASKKIVAKQELATGCPLGMRLPSFQIVNQSGARPWQMHDWLKSNGKYRVLLFAGNIKKPEQRKRMDKWCEEAEHDGSWLQQHTPKGAPIDSIIEILTIHSAPRRDCNLLDDFPAILHPLQDNDMGWDYNKVFVDDESYHLGHGKAYQNYGIDPDRGCVVAVRPDGYTGYIGELEDVNALKGYFAGCLLPANV